MLHVETMREKVFNMRMSAEEWARIEAVSAHYALNAAALIRMLVKREADALLPTRPGAVVLDEAVYFDKATRTKKRPKKAKKK